MITKLNNPYHKDIELSVINTIKEQCGIGEIKSLNYLQDEIGEEWFDYASKPTDEEGKIKHNVYGGQTKIASKLYLLNENNPTYIKLLQYISYELDIDFYFQRTATLRFHKYGFDGNYYFHNDSNTFDQHIDQLNVFLPITTKHTYFSILPWPFTWLMYKLSNNDLTKFDDTLHISNNKIYRKLCYLLSKKYYDLEDMLIWDSKKHIHTALPRNNTNRVSFDFRILPKQHRKVYGTNEHHPYRRKTFIYKPGDFYSSKTIRDFDDL